MACLDVSVLMLPTAGSPGFNVESVEYKNVSFTVWDVGGQDKVYTTHVSSSKFS